MFIVALVLFVTLKSSHFDRINSMNENKICVDLSGDIVSEWVSHDDENFHNFDQDEAEAIRFALLNWYRKERRRLPWRGDPPPYDGSTAGVNSTKKKSEEKNSKGTRSITDFFGKKNNENSPKKSKLKQAQVKDNKEIMEDTEEPPKYVISAYGVWVSEIMLQQTRVEAVIPYYIKWMKSFPTVQSLASATEDEVNAHWAGLGFYRRAKLLHTGAKLVSEEYNGELPKTVNELMKISGIGRYTASAIASIAFGVQVPVVDGNVCRVLSRLKGIANNIKAPVVKDDLGWKLAEQLVSAGDGTCAGELNQALMELGATYCAPSGSGVDERDPLRDFYFSTKLSKHFADELRSNNDDMTPSEIKEKYFAMISSKKKCRLCDDDGINGVISQIIDSLTTGLGEGKLDEHQIGMIGNSALPTAPPKKLKREEVLGISVFSSTGSAKERKWLMVQRPSSGLLALQWEFPAVCMWSSDDKGIQKTKRTSKVAVKRKTNKGNLKKIDVPEIEPRIRKENIDAFLADFLSVTDGQKPRLSEEDEEYLCTLSLSDRNVIEGAIEHVFSHVRHTMWIEHSSIKFLEGFPLSFVNKDGVNVRWMTEGDMAKVGVTSGVKKVLGAVKSATDKKKKRKR